MNTVELLGSAFEPAANSAPGSASVVRGAWSGRGLDSSRAATARGFLIQLTVREIQFGDRSAAWLRELAEHDPGIRGWAQQCRALAEDTRTLRARLVVLLHQLVARRNRLAPGRRVDVIALLAQPSSLAMAELLELHELTVAGTSPWLELAALRPIEQMLAGMIPLAIEVLGVEAGFEHPAGDLREAAELFGARAERASALGSLIANLIATDERRSPLVHELEERSLASFTKVLAECAELGRELDSWRLGFGPRAPYPPKG